MNIILIGFMGSGKSTIGVKLSHLTKFSLCDMDALALKKKRCKTIDQLFIKGGEILLRETEIAIAKKLAAGTNQIISTGGGVVLNKIIIDYFRKKEATVIYLKTSFETILQRLQNDASRPLFNNQEYARKLYSLREPLYAAYADFVLDTDEKSCDEIANVIHQRVFYGL